MTLEAQLNAVLTIIGLVVSAVILYHLWQQLLVDRATEIVLKLRDTWFDSMVGCSDADHPASRAVLRYCEGIHKQTSTLTWPLFGCLLLATRVNRQHAASLLRREIASIENPCLRRRAEATVAAVNRAIFVQMLSRSIFFFPLGMVLAGGNNRLSARLIPLEFALEEAAAWDVFFNN